MKLVLLASLFGAALAQTTADPCPLAGTEPNRTEDGTVQYVIDFLSGIPFAFALGLCNPQEIFGGNYIIYQCDGTQMTKTFYGTSDCSGDAHHMETWNHSSAGIPEGSGYPQDYSCTGDAAYAVVAFSASDSTCSLPTTTYASTGVCVTNGAQNTMVYCDSVSAELQYYTSTGPEVTCYDAQYCRLDDFSEECDYGFGIFVEGFGEVPIYGFLQRCVHPSLTTSTSASPTQTTSTSDLETTESQGDDDGAFIARSFICVLLTLMCALFSI